MFVQHCFWLVKSTFQLHSFRWCEHGAKRHLRPRLGWKLNSTRQKCVVSNDAKRLLGPYFYSTSVERARHTFSPHFLTATYVAMHVSMQASARPRVCACDLTCARTCVRPSVCASERTCVRPCMRARVCACPRVCVLACVRLCGCVRVCASVCAFISACVRSLDRTHVHNVAHTIPRKPINLFVVRFKYYFSDQLLNKFNRCTVFSLFLITHKFLWLYCSVFGWLNLHEDDTRPKCMVSNDASLRLSL